MMYVTYRGPDGNIKWNKYDGKTWYCTNGVNWRFALGELGLVSFNTRLHLSYAEAAGCSSDPTIRIFPEKGRQSAAICFRAHVEALQVVVLIDS